MDDKSLGIELEAFNLKQGDLLVVYIPCDSEMEEILKVAEKVTKIVPHVNLLVVDERINFEHVDKKYLADLGYEYKGKDKGNNNGS